MFEQTVLFVTKQTITTHVMYSIYYVGICKPFISGSLWSDLPKHKSELITKLND